MISESVVLGVIPFIPLVGAGLIVLLRRSPNVRETVSVATATVLFGTVVSLIPYVNAGQSFSFTLVRLMPGLEVALMVEPLGLLYALVASGLWLVTSVYSIGYMRAHHEQHQTRFAMCFALTLATAMGIAFAANVFTLFVFYEMMTLVTYPLVTHAGTEEAVRAGRVYLGILFTTSVGFLLLAIVWTWVLAGTLDFKAGGILAGKAGKTTLYVLLALYVFGIGKAALMPFHRWLPAAMVAPTPVSALLHAVAVVKAGVFAVMKVVVYIFGINFLHETGLSLWLMYVAAATILIASLVALTKDNLKARLAYSTVSQLSYVILGAALANAWGVIGGSMHIVMHAFGKITLFFCAGAIYVATHKTNVSEMKHIGKTMPITMIAFFIGAVSVIGLPPLGGSWSKWYLIMGAVRADQVILVVVLIISSLLNIAYLMPVVVRGFFVSEVDPGVQTGVKEAPLLCLIPLCVTAAGCLILFFFADNLYHFLSHIVSVT